MNSAPAHTMYITWLFVSTVSTAESVQDKSIQGLWQLVRSRALHITGSWHQQPREDKLDDFWSTDCSVHIHIYVQHVHWAHNNHDNNHCVHQQLNWTELTVCLGIIIDLLDVYFCKSILSYRNKCADNFGRFCVIFHRLYCTMLNNHDNNSWVHQHVNWTSLTVCLAMGYHQGFPNT